MDSSFVVRIGVAAVLACGLATHGYKKGSLDWTGAVAAVVVGFASFSVSYRMGLILIVFYYTGSKMTKVRGDLKERYEYNYKLAGQRNAAQVLTNSLLATVIAVLFYFVIGEDTHNVEFAYGKEIRGLLLVLENIMYQKSYVDTESSRIFYRIIASYLWSAFVAHYACACGDTLASELGILSRSAPRSITSFFTKQVPRGTNGGVSLEGTMASALGGALIGLTFWICAMVQNLGLASKKIPPQYPMIVAATCSGVVGSLVDSLLGATLQATYFNSDTKQIVKTEDLKLEQRNDSTIKRIQGVDILSNEAVNFFSIAITMLLSLYYTPLIFNCI